MNRSLERVAAAAVIALFGLATPADAETAPATVPEERCVELAAIGLKDVEIISARLETGGPVAGASMPSMADLSTTAGAQISGLPAFCRVIGRIRPEPKSDIGFEVWMPRDGWDGRLSGAGSPGAAGSILYYMLVAAVRGGQAGVSNDGGHRGGVDDVSWAPGHPERLRDYGWRATHLSAIAAKALIARYYGRPADHAYFIGVSNGGREALVEASHFPEDYDGILAGAPVPDSTKTRMAQLWARQAQLPPGASIRPSQAKLLQAEVLRQCDALDGQLDGLVDDPRRCHVDTQKLACGISNSPDCFAPAQVVALERIYSGRKDKHGRWAAMPYLPAGSEVSDPLFGWDRAFFTTDDKTDAARAQVPVQTLDGQTIATLGELDFDRDPSRYKAANAVAGLDPSSDLQRFFARGGKLIIWHGWADSSIPPKMAIEYYEEVQRESGPLSARSMRLFMIPGMQHGFGGKGADLFGALMAPPTDAAPESNIAAALQAWVETGRVPDSFVGQRHSIGATEAGAPAVHPPRERLICAYARRAVLKPGADPDHGASYLCQP
jgi:feruloyl esterase